MDLFTSFSNSIRYPRFPERYWETADGAISSIRDASTWDTPHFTSSTAIAARIAGQDIPDYLLAGGFHHITTFKLSQS